MLFRSDGDYISDIAREYDVEVYRRKESSKDLQAAAEDMLNYIYYHERILPEAVIFLFATSPFREPDLIDKCVAAWRNNDDINTVFTVTQNWNWYASGHINNNNFEFLSELNENRKKQTQDNKFIYQRVGSVYVCSVHKEWIKNNHLYLPEDFYLNKNIKAIEQHAPYSIDIDDIYELEFARKICHLFM